VVLWVEGILLREKMFVEGVFCFFLIFFNH
jgi:hypothetical protein